jgi:hypothetical protein
MLKTIAATLISMTITVTATAQSSDPLPGGAGKPLVQRMCGGCHNLRVVTSQRATHDRWETIVQQMVARGVDATDEEIETMVDYLAKNYPPTAKATAPPQSPSSSPHRVTDRHPTVSLIGDRSWMTARQCDIDALFRLWSRSALRTKTTPQSHQKTDTLSKAYRSRRSPDHLGHVSLAATQMYAKVDSSPDAARNISDGAARYQHHPRMARTRLHRHHQLLRGSRSAT